MNVISPTVMKVKFHYWLNYKVQGFERSMITTTEAVSERAAKSHIKSCYGKSVKITYIEVQNQGIIRKIFPVKFIF